MKVVRKGCQDCESQAGCGPTASLRLKQSSAVPASGFWKAFRVRFGLAAVALLVLQLCLSEPRPSSHSFLHAVRVGEASNPGPKGNSDADSALASALLEVLKSCKRPSGPRNSRSVGADEAVGPRGPTALNASEWTKPVKLVSRAAVLKAVEQGSDIEGIVTVVKSEAEARELKALWNAATRYDPLIVLLVADCKSL